MRILATTNKDLERAVTAGSFRADLYYRLNVVRIQLPPLRERMMDVPLLAEHFLHSFCEKNARKVQAIAPQVMRALLEYDWPGNVRELANVIELAAIMTTGQEIVEVDLATCAAPKHSQALDADVLDLSFKNGRQQVVARYEEAYLRRCLRRHQGNIAQCAQHCGIDAKTFYRKMLDYGLDKRDFKKTGLALEE